MLFDAWAHISAEDANSDAPESFAFHVEANCACAAREQARSMLCEELKKLGFNSEPVPTNKHEVCAVDRFGTEIVYIVDCE